MAHVNGGRDVCPGPVHGLAELGRRVAQVADAHRDTGAEIGGPCPRYPEDEPVQGVERLPQRLGRRDADVPAHGAAPEEDPMSTRSLQGSRFQSSCRFHKS